MAHKILLIEDEANIQGYVKAVLQRVGYEVTICGTAAQARITFQAGRCDLVIVDIGLPDGNGLDLVRELGLGAGGVPVIFLTASGDLKTRLEGFQVGAQDYISKPFALEELLARVRAHLRMKRSRDDLARCNYELERRHHARQDLTDMLVHDLKTPLTSIKGTLELATRPDLITEPVYKNLLSTAGTTTDLMTLMLNDLLSLGRAEQACLVPRLAPVNMEILVSRVQALFQSHCRIQGVRLETRVAPEATLIETDANLVFRILVNLVANALKFSPRGEAVTLAVGLHHSHPRFEVGDCGLGVPDEQKGRIFDKYVSGDYRQGTGIGLAFCRAASQALKGDIRIEDRPGGGSLFVVDLRESRILGSYPEAQSRNQRHEAAESGRPAGRPPASQDADAARGDSAMRWRGRTFLMVGFLLLLVSAIGAVSLTAIGKGLSLRAAEERINSAWETVASISREMYITHDPLLLVNTVKMIERTHPEVRWICVVDTGEKILASQDVNLFGADRRSVKLPEGLRLLVRPVVFNGVNLGRIEMGLRYEDVLSSHTRIFLFRLAAWLIVAALGFVSFLMLAYNLAGAVKGPSRGRSGNQTGRTGYQDPYTAQRRNGAGDYPARP